MILTKKTSLWIFILSLVYFNVDILISIKNIVDQLGAYYYPLDDTYIHLSIVKNICNHGVWGMTPHEFSSSSSSPLFTVVLVILSQIFGDPTYLPLYLNIVLANLLLVIIYRFFKQNPWQLLVVYLGFFLLVLLRIQVLTAMEHVMQILFITTAWLSFVRWRSHHFQHQKLQYLFYISIFFTCVSRYEGMFFVAMLCLYMLYIKQSKKAIFTGVLAFLPMLIFGLYNLQNAGHFFPNSLLMKGKHSFDIPAIMEIISDTYKNIFHGFHVLLLACLISAIYMLFKQKNKQEWLLYIVVLASVLLHLVFASIIGYYRYDAYLIALHLLALTAIYPQIKIYSNWQKQALLALLFVSVTVMFIRERKSQYASQYASKNIHDQQVQMGRFVQKYYPTSQVMANDIGAICYYSDIKLHDLIGLGTNKYLDIHLQKNKDFDAYTQIVPYDLMMIYDEWFPNLKFGPRHKVAQLKILNNKACAVDKVSFYVKHEHQKAYAIKSLKAFKPTLPKDVFLDIYE